MRITIRKQKEEETVNETQLIRRCQRGDRQAFETLIRQYYDYVSGFLLKATQYALLAQDLTQETFLKMIRSIETFDCNGAAGMGTWLVTIAKNCYVDYLRKNRIVREDVDDLPLSDGKDVSDLVARRLQYQKALAAIDSLPPEQGLAIRLKYVESLTLQEIAQRFGVPQKTIKSRIHEGTVKLRKLLKKEDG